MSPLNRNGSLHSDSHTKAQILNDHSCANTYIVCVCGCWLMWLCVTVVLLHCGCSLCVLIYLLARLKDAKYGTGQYRGKFDELLDLKIREAVADGRIDRGFHHRGRNSRHGVAQPE